MAVGLFGLASELACGGLTVGTNLNFTKLAGNQTETTIAINPLNPQNLFVAANHGTFPTPGVFRYTTNGGATWTNSDISSLPTACCDEASASDNCGNLCVNYLTVIGSTAVVGMSMNGGTSFPQLFQFTNKIDQPSIAVGPGGACAPGSVEITFAGPSGWTVQGAAANGFGSLSASSGEQITPRPAGTFGDIAVGPIQVTIQTLGEREFFRLKSQ